jgi:hypothetical protein
MEKSTPEERTYVILMISTPTFTTTLMLDLPRQCKENTVLNMPKKLIELMPKTPPKKLLMKENTKEPMETKLLAEELPLDTTELKTQEPTDMEETNT